MESTITIELSEDDIAGATRHYNNCPIARWIKRHYPTVTQLCVSRVQATFILPETNELVIWSLGARAKVFMEQWENGSEWKLERSIAQVPMPKFIVTPLDLGGAF